MQVYQTQFIQKAKARARRLLDNPFVNNSSIQTVAYPARLQQTSLAINSAANNNETLAEPLLNLFDLEDAEIEGYATWMPTNKEALGDGSDSTVWGYILADLSYEWSDELRNAMERMGSPLARLNTSVDTVTKYLLEYGWDQEHWIVTDSLATEIVSRLNQLKNYFKNKASKKLQKYKERRANRINKYGKPPTIDVARLANSVREFKRWLDDNYVLTEDYFEMLYRAAKCEGDKTLFTYLANNIRAQNQKITWTQLERNIIEVLEQYYDCFDWKVKVRRATKFVISHSKTV